MTKQTTAAGKICNSVMVTTRMFPRKEYYIAVMLERAFDVRRNCLHPLEICQTNIFIVTSGACDNRFQTRWCEHRGDRC